MCQVVFYYFGPGELDTSFFIPQHKHADWGVVAMPAGGQTGWTVKFVEVVTREQGD